MKYDDEAMSEPQMKREKERARHLRQSEWWLRKVHKGFCYYCHRQVGRAHLTMDHVVPISRGGRSNKGNIVPACKECNTKKKYLVPVEWDEYLQTLANRSLDP